MQRRVTRRRSAPPMVAITFRAGDNRKRLQFLFVVSAALFAGVVVKVVYLQTAGSESLRAEGRAQRVREQVLPAPRGTIFASDGGELAISVPSSSVYADPKMITDPTGVASVLASMLGLGPDTERSLVEAFTAKENSFVYVARQIDDDLAQTVLDLNLTGVGVIREDRRTMPSGAVGRSLVGRTDIDGNGTAGVELQFNDLLTGIDGERVRERDTSGRSLPGSGTAVEPIPGKDIVLTIDRSLQYQVEQLLMARVGYLKAAGGTVVVMDTDDGGILAAANVDRDDDETIRVTSANLAAVNAFEPGSVAKVFSHAAVIDAGLAGPRTEIDVPGVMVFDEGTPWEKTLRDAEPHEEMKMSMREVLVHSSNLGTYLLAERLGSRGLYKYLRAFGFGDVTAVDFPGETKGIIDRPSEWQGTEKVTVTYGYHYSTSAFQLVAGVNAVANGGMYVEPRLLEAVIGSDGRVTPAQASGTHQVIKPSTARAMTSMMLGVVCEGTGVKAQVEGMPVAGKTGTAYKARNGSYDTGGARAYRATFVGYFPADNPQVTILVTIDEPDPYSNDRFGGTASAPLFAEIATAAIHDLRILPTPGGSGCPAAG